MSDEERDALTPQQRNELAGEIVADLMQEDYEETWTVEDQNKLEAEAQQYQTTKDMALLNDFIVCEQCLCDIGIQGKSKWVQLPCDICGDKDEYCAAFDYNDVMQAGGAYDNDPEIMGVQAAIDNEGAEKVITDIQHGRDFSKAEKNLQHLHANLPAKPYPTYERFDPERIRELGIMVCSFCGNNWQKGWHLRCFDCKSGRKMIQKEPMNLTRTPALLERVCETCSEEWLESVESTTCRRCEWGVVTFRAVNQIPDVPPRVASSARDPQGHGEFEPSGVTLVQDYESGTLVLKKGPSEDTMGLDMTDEHLYRISED